jgi:hypothetical protein
MLGWGDTITNLLSYNINGGLIKEESNTKRVLYNLSANNTIQAVVNKTKNISGIWQNVDSIYYEYTVNGRLRLINTFEWSSTLYRNTRKDTFTLSNNGNTVVETRKVWNGVIFAQQEQFTFNYSPAIVTTEPLKVEVTAYSIYPNPTNSEFHIKMNTTIPNANIYLYDLQGKEVYSSFYPLLSTEEAINTHKLPKGLYILKIQNETIQQSQKVFINNN